MKLNKRQRIAVFIGLVVVALMAIVPPVRTSERYLWITYGERVNFECLVLQWFAVAVLTTGAVIVLKDRDDDEA